jgi:hypothetical protein
MWNSYSLDRFSLSRAFQVEEIGNSDEFLYLLVMALWTEGIENRKFNLKTRILRVETLLLFFLNQESLMNLPCASHY